MKNANSLDTQTAYLWIIFGRHNSPLSKDFSYYIEKLVAWCKINARMWAFIGHDKDLEEDGETPKFRHIHGVIILKEGVKPRLSTSLNRLAQITGLPNEDIDIDSVGQLRSCVRYLTHADYPLKQQYPLEDIVTNLSKSDLEGFFDKEECYITANYLIQLVTICNYSVVMILREIGLKNYAKYRNVIIDLIKELDA